MNKRAIFAVAGACVLAAGLAAAEAARAKEMHKNLKSLGTLPASFSPSWIYKKDSPAVVVIMALDSSGGGEMGTGSIIDASGYVITNAHVIVNKATDSPFSVIRVYMKPERVTGDAEKDLSRLYPADIVQYDRGVDLAVLHMRNAPAHLPVMFFGDSSSMQPGDHVVAIGNPEEGGLWTLTQGVISTVMANFGGVAGKNVFQTDASINRGNSGGPLIDRNGQMIGINTAMARKAPDGLTITSVNFAIQAAVVKGWLNGNASQVAYTDVSGSPASASQEEVAQASNGGTSQAGPGEDASAPAASSHPMTTTAANQAPEQAQAAATSPESHIVTRKHPYQIDALIQAQIAKMERTGSDMKSHLEQKLGVKPLRLKRHHLGGGMEQEMEQMEQGDGQDSGGDGN